MSFHIASDGPAGEPAPFACDWRPDGIAAASAQVAGELDTATAPQLEQTLLEALEQARLVVLDLRGLSFVDSSGLHVLLDATQHARRAGARLVLAGASAELERLVELTGTRALLDMLPGAPATGPVHEDPVAVMPQRALDSRPGESDPRADERRIQPFENPVNVLVVSARVMDVADRGLWSHGPDGTIRRAWAPASARSAVPAGTVIELYLDDRGAINGWWLPGSDVAINQRHLAAGDAEPLTAAALACQGPCGLVWQAPAAAKLTDHDERCLTCAGALALI
jgi:anti-anti-sigma factor